MTEQTSGRTGNVSLDIDNAHTVEVFLSALQAQDIEGAGAVLDAGGDLNLGIIFAPRFLAPIIGLSVLACIPIVYKKIKARKAVPSA